MFDHFSRISAGFDAGDHDAGCSKYFSDNGMDLAPADFRWVTEQLQAVAEVTACQGRVVSVLEGGYGRYVGGEAGFDRSNLGRNAAAHVLGLASAAPPALEPPV